MFVVWYCVDLLVYVCFYSITYSSCTALWFHIVVLQELSSPEVRIEVMDAESTTNLNLWCHFVYSWSELLPVWLLDSLNWKKNWTHFSSRAMQLYLHFFWDVTELQLSSEINVQIILNLQLVQIILEMCFSCFTEL